MALPNVQFKVTATDIVGATATTIITPTSTVAQDILVNDTRWFDGTWATLTFPVVGLKMEVDVLNPMAPLPNGFVRWGFHINP